MTEREIPIVESLCCFKMQNEIFPIASAVIKKKKALSYIKPQCLSLALL